MAFTKLKRVATALCLLSVSMTQAATTKLQDSVKEVVLDNGMTFLMVQQPGQPNIVGGWVAKVGSANEKPGITGISHLFEHMLFKGSPRIGVKKAKLDDKIRGQLDDIRNQMIEKERGYREQVRLGYGASVTDAELQDDEMKALQKEFDALIEKQRENLVKDEFDQVYTAAGASGMNAFTNQDMTVYFIRVPKNKLEMWMWMESERLSQPVFREFYSERDVVYEERRMRTESTPTGAQDEVFNSMFWRGHPYGWPVVGWPSDISAITREQAANYFDQYYAPNNLTFALVGDFDEDEAIKMAKKYFGRIPSNGKKADDVITLGMPLLGDFNYETEVDAPPSATIQWRTTAFGGKDDPALSVLAGVLSGKTGRLYKRLVLEDQIATSASAQSNTQKFDGSFSVAANGKKGISPKLLKKTLLEEVQKIIDEGITDYELEKQLNQSAAGQFRRLEDPFFLAIQLLYFEGLRDWRTMDTNFERLNKVTKADVQAVAEKYLTGFKASALYTRKVSDEPVDPELAALSQEDQDQVKQMLGQLAMVPPAQLPAIVARIEGSMAQAPADKQAAMQYLLKQLKKRLDKAGE
ncbi:M16 family metallopeptidase [Marinicella rhabdoformis]|uniref:M16 family metallopeptidase n=1 Tax=Marinicella rhabdoformis TaxID=2580566 RepID=UPI0012AEB9DC|nr:pitrilysin family protein [Marinicella rhabdoformis]